MNGIIYYTTLTERLLSLRNFSEFKPTYVKRRENCLKIVFIIHWPLKLFYKLSGGEYNA